MAVDQPGWRDDGADGFAKCELQLTSWLVGSSGAGRLLLNWPAICACLALSCTDSPEVTPTDELGALGGLSGPSDFAGLPYDLATSQCKIVFQTLSAHQINAW